MAAHELAGAIARRAAPREHGNAREVPADVLGQLVHRGVAQLGLLAQRLQDDRVEVAAQTPRQAVVVSPPGHRRSAPGSLLTAVLGRSGSRSQTTRISSSGSPVVDAVRLAAREQLVEDDAERVHVGRGRDAAAAHLLGARVLGRHEPQLRPVVRSRVASRAVGLEQLGDAEVEQLGHAVGRDEDVAGLDVAVHDEVLVRVLHGAQTSRKSSRRLVDRQPPVRRSSSMSGSPSTYSMTK